MSSRAEQLAAEGNRVWADARGYPEPPVISGHRPDIIALSGTRDLISETETSDSYDSDHTYSQLKAFDSEPAYRLEVVVPKSVLPLAKALYLAWQISVDSWMQYEG